MNPLLNKKTCLFMLCCLPVGRAYCEEKDSFLRDNKRTSSPFLDIELERIKKNKAKSIRIPGKIKVQENEKLKVIRDLETIIHQPKFDSIGDKINEQKRRPKKKLKKERPSLFRRFDFLARPKVEYNDRNYPRLDILIENLEIQKSPKQTRREIKTEQNDYRLKPEFSDWMTSSYDSFSLWKEKGITFRPTFKFKSRYEDNIFNTKTNRIADFVHDFNTGFSFAMKAKHSFDLKYGIRPTLFFQREDENFLAHEANMNFIYNTKSPLKINFAQVWNYTGTPRTEERQVRSISSDHKLSLGATYQFPDKKTNADIKFGYDRLAYVDQIHYNLNKDTFSVNGVINRTLTPKISSKLNFKRSEGDFVKSPNIMRDADHDRDETGLRFDYKFNATWMFNAGIGYQKIAFKNALDEDSNPRNNNDLVFYEATASYKWNKDYTFKYDWKENVEQYLNKISASVNKKLNELWIFDGSLSYQINDQNAVDTPARKDKNFNLDSSLKYRFNRNMVTELGYSFVKTTSSVSSREELSNTIIFKLDYSPK